VATYPGRSSLVALNCESPVKSKGFDPPATNNARRKKQPGRM